MEIVRHRLDTVRDQLAARRAARAARRDLERELSAYTTHADLMELDAIMARHSAEETQVLREVLDRRWGAAA